MRRPSALASRPPHGGVNRDRDGTRRSERSEYRALALMYLAQGLPAGLAFYALGTLIRAGGHSVADVGLSGLAFLPWAFKFLWAAPLDNACARWGHARVVLFSQALAVLLCLALLPLSPAEHLGGALAGIVLLNTVCATQDIATNAYAVSRMQGRAAGTANAIQVAGFIAGMLLGGGGLLVVHGLGGWTAAIGLLAGLMTVLGGLLWADKHWQANPTTQPAVPLPRVRLRDLLRHTDLGWMLALALLFKFPGTAVSTLLQPWLVDRGLPVDAIGQLQIATLLATAVGGVALGMPLVRRLGNRRAVRVSFTLAALALGAAWGLARAEASAIGLYYAAFCLQGVFEGAMYVAVWSLVLNWASPRAPGTDFTAMQCSESLANALAAGLVGGLGQQLGYAQAFGLAWLAAFLALALIAACLPRLTLHKDSTTP